MATTRAQLIKIIRPSLPKSWRIIRSVRAIDKVATTTLVVNQTRIEPSPAAQGAQLVTFELALIHPGEDVEKAEDALDDETQTLLYALNRHRGLAVTAATKQTFLAEQHLGYQFELTITTRKD